MMKMMKQSIKRMVLTGAAVTVMMSLALPAAIAQEVRDHRDGSGEAGPIVRDHRDGSGGILCDIFSVTCDDPPPYDVSDPGVPPPVVNDPPDPVVDPPPKHCEFLPTGCKPPFGDNPVLGPGDDEDPVVADPPDKEDPVTDPPDKEDPDKEDPDKDEQPDTDGGSGATPSGGSGGSAATAGFGSSGGSVSSASQTIDRGGSFVSRFLPYALTTKMSDAGSAVKKNLPAPVAKSLPNTGGGGPSWS